MSSHAISIPQFGLYGEPGWIDDPEFIHIEDIASRSSDLGWMIGAHRHGRLFQLLYLQEGDAEVHLDDQITLLQGPWVITIPPGVVHSFRFAPKTKGAVVTLAEPLLQTANDPRSQRYFDALFSRPQCIDFAGRDSLMPQLQQTLMEIQQEFSHNYIGRSLMCEWMIRILLLTLHRQLDLNGQSNTLANTPNRTIRQLKQLIEQHYRDHWTVTQYAAALGTSISRLNRLTRELLNQSAKQMIHERLLLETKRRLIYTRSHLDDIAYGLGFKDPGYFSRYFKRAVGIPPSRFRSENNFETTAE